MLKDIGINRLSLIFLGAESSVIVEIRQERIPATKFNLNNKIIITEERKNPIDPSRVLSFILIKP